MFYFFRKKVIRKKKKTSISYVKSRKLYLENKEKARALVLERLEYYNNFYNFKYNIISIRDQKTRWGSCSSRGNLNFNYKIIFLDLELVDYIIAHELCHLKEMNHAKAFWDLVSLRVPDYKVLRSKLKVVRLNEIF